MIKLWTRTKIKKTDSKAHIIDKLSKNDEQLKRRLQLLEREARVISVRTD